MMLMQVSILLLHSALIVQCTDLRLPVLNSFSVSNPGFVTLAKNTSIQGKVTWDIIISRFNGFPFSTDYVSLVRDIGHFGSSSQVEDISQNLHWPNEPDNIPEQVFNRSGMVIIPSGFLVPTKGEGALTVFDLEGTESMSVAYPVTTNNDGEWFYHRAVFLDMDGDGRDDIVTCRAQKPLIGSVKAEMVWLKQPDASTPWNEQWKVTTLSEGDGAPDTFLIPVQLKTVRADVPIQTLITAGYFSKSLDIWWRKDEAKPWTADNLNKRQLDSGEGNTFDLIYADLNSDGVPELLVTYNKPSNGTVFIYEISGDPRTGTVVKHLIMSGIDPAKSGVGKGAPGGIKLTWPDLRKTDGRPDIILSGDDNGKLYLLRAVQSTGWKYNSTVLLDASPGTMGAMAVGDINNDSYPEIIAPSYNDNKITILSYNPATEAFTTENPTNHKNKDTWLHRLLKWLKSLFNLH